MKFNAEQVTEYLNMEAAYKKMERMFKKVTPEDYTEAEYEEICLRHYTGGETPQLCARAEGVKWVLVRSNLGYLYVLPRKHAKHMGVAEAEVVLESEDYDELVRFRELTRED